jgi:hypothetical protein
MRFKIHGREDFDAADDVVEIAGPGTRAIQRNRRPLSEGSGRPAARTVLVEWLWPAWGHGGKHNPANGPGLAAAGGKVKNFKYRYCFASRRSS